MARLNIVLPAMGEGVIEATIIKWLVTEGARVKEDDPVAEVATDKVDSEIPSPASGTITEIRASEGSVVRVGEIMAILEDEKVTGTGDTESIRKEVDRIRESISSERAALKEESVTSREMRSRTPSGKFLSPLVRNIASRENISYAELDTLKGTGMDGRITRDDLLGLIAQRGEKAPLLKSEPDSKPTVKTSDHDEVIQMDRKRKLIAEHMVMSKRTSPHVTSFIDADVTKMINWRNGIKDKFFSTEGQKLTLTPIFADAAARALREFPMINSSVEGDTIVIKHNINIGIATALPDGNLIVPVIKNADEKSLTGLAKAVNDLAERARSSRLKPDEVAGGTFTITNFGTYNNLAGTPIINQPQAAILGTGAVRKMPAVVETSEGDMIGIRHIIILSLSYDHRIIDGALAGKFLNRIRELLENYTPDSI